MYIYIYILKTENDKEYFGLRTTSFAEKFLKLDIV